MDTVMSWPEIEETFNEEWVLIEDPEFSPGSQFISGKVIFHSKDRVEISVKMAELTRVNHALKYIGGLPEGMEMIL